MNTKKILLILFILGVVLTLSLPTLAATDYKVILKSSSTKLNPGDTVKVTVSISNIAVSEGLGAFVGKLTYDTQIFEAVTQEDIVGATGWGSILYNPDAGYLAVERAAGDGVKTDNDVMVITLKVKSNATTKDAQVTLSEITCSTGEEDLLAADAKSVISVVQNNGNSGNTNSGNTNSGNTNSGNTNSGNTNSGNTNSGNTNSGNTNSGNTNSGNTNSGNTNSGNTNNTKNPIKNTANSELPKAGQNNIIVTLIVVVILIGAISYINYRKIKNI